MNVSLNEAMRNADAGDMAARAIERELDPRELEAALDDAINGVALALLDRARAMVVRRIADAQRLRGGR